MTILFSELYVQNILKEALDFINRCGDGGMDCEGLSEKLESAIYIQGNLREAAQDMLQSLGMVLEVEGNPRDMSFNQIREAAEKGERALAPFKGTDVDRKISEAGLYAEPNVFIVIHQLGCGSTSYLVECRHEPTEEEVVEACNLCFEPEIGERLIIDLLCSHTIVKIPSEGYQGR